MAEELEQGTNIDTGSAESGTPQEQNTNDSGTLLGGNQDGANQEQDAPTEPIKYDFAPAFDGGVVDENIANEFSKLLNGVGATQEQAVELAKFGSKYGTDLVTAYEEQRQLAEQKQYADYAAHTKEVLGAKFDETVAQASVGVEAVEKEIPNIREILSQNGLGNRLEVIQLFAHIANMAGEDNNSNNGKAGNTYISEEERAKMLYPSMSK
ncbi:hypothetical protein [uncultured Veillonella sp.]|uniref:hypothetical protein n=1 Tax=uncultured Veillonella sp. TaxID=159268 RepID=UPI002626372E|nr:hypothetical protein [uncultured Veillonella sp.]